MDKVKTVTQTIDGYIHSFYCDNCNKYLGETEECDDGWYQELGEFELSFCILGKWYKIKRHFCDDCIDKFLTNLKETLKGIGFVESTY